MPTGAIASVAGVSPGACGTTGAEGTEAGGEEGLSGASDLSFCDDTDNITRGAIYNLAVASDYIDGCVKPTAAAYFLRALDKLAGTRVSGWLKKEARPGRPPD